MQFIDWDRRPAILTSSEPLRAWAVLAPGREWVEINPFEAIYSPLVADETALREMFRKKFGHLPPLPEGACIADQASPDSSAAAE